MPSQDTDSSTSALSLSTLCAICHLQPPKYTCPRCTTRTCSMPCVRRHKLRAQCPGTRDPAAPLKRKDLRTPAGFDRDYNFLSGVERAVEKAGRATGYTAGQYAPGQEEGEGRGAGGVVKGEIPFLKAVERAGITLVRAPVGMARRKGNESTWNRRQKCIGWSVEWILPDGREEKSRPLETMDVAAAFGCTEWAKTRKRSDGEECGGRENKRRRKVGANETLRNQEPRDGEGEGEAGSSQSKQERSRTLTPEPERTTRPTTEAETETDTSAPDPAKTKLYFYLHRPRSQSKVPVLIPLRADTTLSNALRGSTVLEFPTIYVLEYDLAGVGVDDARYILEERYLEENPAEVDGSGNVDSEDKG